MKKVLVTGAAGTIGLQVIKYLLSEGKYEITALDLKNNKSRESLKKYKQRINIIFGDVCDQTLMEALVKDFDVIIHLAGVLPPLADLKKDLASQIDYEGVARVVRCINYYNPKCHLFYASTMLLYKNKRKFDVKSHIKLDDYDYYLQAKKKCEDLIKNKLKNYTIYRFPTVLSLVNESLILNGYRQDKIYWIAKEDAAYSFVKGINYLNKLNGQTFNVLAKEAISYQDLLNHILKNYGLSLKYIYQRTFIDKYPSCQECLDIDILNDIINYRSTTLEDYYQKLKKAGQKRPVAKVIARIFVRD